MNTNACIKLIAVNAYAPLPGLIGAVSGRPALDTQYAESIEDAKNKAQAMHDALRAAGESHMILVLPLGRKPRGFDAAKQAMRHDFIKGE